jgi:hypothetical protein
MRRLAGHVSAALAIVHSRLRPLTTTDPRVAATAALLGMIIIAAAASAFPIAVTAVQATSPALSKADDAPAAIKFIGATPRSESCADQVWPYIERRCLRRATGSNAR